MSKEFAAFLEQSLRSGSPLVYCETSEDERVRDIACDVAEALPGFAFLHWTCTLGLVRIDDSGGEQIFPAEQVATFEALLEHLIDPRNGKHFERSLVILASDAVGSERAQQDASAAGLRFARLLKDLHQEWEPTAGEPLRRCLLMTGLGWAIPTGLNGYLQTTELPLPLGEVLLEELRTGPEFERAIRRHGIDAVVFGRRVAGLPLLAIRDIVRRLESQAPAAGSSSALSIIDRIKREEIRKTGVLEILPTDEDSELGGFGNFKRWFAERKPFLESPDRPELRPRGVLLLGFPGSGKSYTARWIARELRMPLIALNLGQVQDRWVGASEANLRMALRTLEAVAPVVVLMDEIEKDLAGQGTDTSGVMTRLVGHLLRWLSDRRAPVFVVATCNKAGNIPPELTRTGRFDANFIVPVPSDRERIEILSVLLRRLHLEASDALRHSIVQHTAEFTGAELQQLLVEAAYVVGARTRTLTTESVRTALTRMAPLMRRDEGRQLWADYEKRIGRGYQLVGDAEGGTR